MLPKLNKYLAQFQSFVINCVDEDGLPFSMRCRLQSDSTRQVLRLQLPAETPLRPGPASLLGHSHDEKLWNMKNFLVRGLLEQENETWLFHPLQVIPGQSVDGAIEYFQSVRKMQNSAAAYLSKRNLPRLKIDWQAFKVLWKQVSKQRN